MAGSSPISTAPEVEATIDRLMSHRGVKGVLILDNASGRVIRYAGPALEATSTAGAAAADSAVVLSSGENDAMNNSKPDTPHALLNENVQRYAKAARSIVQASSHSLAALDDQVRLSQAMRVGQETE